MPYIETTNSFSKSPRLSRDRDSRQSNDTNTPEYIKIARLLAGAKHVICKGDDKRLDIR